MIDHYPDVPLFHNLLATAYFRLGKIKRAFELVEENYRRHPKYFPNRINLAQLCLGRGELDRIPEIFDHEFSLTRLMPNRKLFHFTEFASFMCVVGRYSYRIGEIESAQQILAMLEEMDPSSEFTNSLRREIKGSLWSRLLGLIRIGRRRRAAR